MKKRNLRKTQTERSILGLTQQEVAMILNVSRGHYAHHEGNKKKLSTTAGLRFSEMIIYMLSPEAKALEKSFEPEFEDNRIKAILEEQLKEIEFELEVFTRKRNKVLEKFEKFEKAVRLMGFLNSPAEVEKAASKKILKTIEEKAIMSFDEAKYELNLMQIELDLLNLQQEYFQKSIKELQ